MGEADNYSIKEYIEHAMDDMKEKITTIHSDVKEIKGDLVPRVAILENHKAWLWGSIATLVFISTILGFLIRFWVEQSVKIWAKESVTQALKDQVESVRYEK